MAYSGKRDRGPYKRNRGGDFSHHHKQKREDGKSDDVEITPALKAFKDYQSELDSKHDKYERLVKISRDITIESKRIIFLLHRIEGDSEKVLEEAKNRLETVQENLISKVAHELKGQDVHQFLRAFSPGLQEFIEAVAFYLFIKEERLVSLEEVSSRLTFHEQTEKRPSKKEEVTLIQENDSETKPSSSESDTSKETANSAVQTETAVGDDSDDKKSESQRTSSSPPQLSLPLPLLEVMLGIADFTGELMRLCINTVGSGDLERPFQLLGFMRSVSEGFQLLGNVAGREMVRKSSVMRQSLKKIEDACYVIKVRGSEIPKHMLKDAIIIPSEFSSVSRDSGYDQEA